MRPMDEGDIEFALRLTDNEGWAYTQSEFERILRLPHMGCYVWEEDEPIGFVTSVQFGVTAVIGHLVVAAEARGRKVGRHLLEASLRELDSEGIESVLVFSTISGERLYPSFGFRRHRSVVSYGLMASNRSQSPRCPALASTDMADVCRIDEAVFGDDRSALLRELWREHPDLCFKTETDGELSGFIFGRRTPLGGDFGPWCSTTGSHEDARDLVQSVLSCFRGERVDTGFFDDSPVARSVIQDTEAVKRFSVSLMVRGDDRYPSERSGALGIAGFELG